MSHPIPSGSRAHRILIVDDTPTNLEIAVRYLEKFGYEILVAQDGEEALERAARVRPDLILLDVMMPGIDGFETCRRLKAQDATRETPVIFMTALHGVDDKITAYSAGGVDYVTKPFQVEELLARVRTHLNLADAQRHLAQRNALLSESELRYRRLFEASADGILLFDFDSGEIVGINESLETLLGYSRTQLLGRPIDQVPPFREAAARDDFVSSLRHTERVHIDHWLLSRSDGLIVDVEFHANRYAVGERRMVQCLIRDITERRETEARMRYMALHDGLTGLANRTMLLERLGQTIGQADRAKRQVAVLLLDLDNFKHVNDSLGHHVGDRLLEACAGRLRRCLREGDTAARLGGDEFVLVQSDCHSDSDATALAKRVIRTLVDPFKINDRVLHIGASIGISRYPADASDPAVLLQAADTAMYAAKNNGRSTWAFFTPELNQAAQRRLTLANDVRLARERGELTVHYQPQICVETREITGVEALLRWKHPHMGMIPPDEFVPLLEETGQIAEVGRWVLETACRQNAEWQRRGLKAVRVAVNVSAHQFYRGDIVTTVGETLVQAGLDPGWLELELTETLTLDDTEATIEIMHGLKALGVRLSLDDFGTGWSALSYLRRFPLDRIKIDRSFMREVLSHPSASAVVRSIIGLGRNLGLGCIAEGVETDEQLQYLHHQMCGEMQGFLFSPAVPADDIQALLQPKVTPIRAAGH